MDEPLIDDVQILPEKALTIEEAFHKVRHEVVLNVDNSEEKLHNIFLFDFLPFVCEFLLKGSFDFVPAAFELKAEILFSHIEQLRDLIQRDLKNAVGVPSILRLLSLSPCVFLL